MISFKKSYAEQMLQLVLALSLLQVDPENYLGRSWETQLNIHNGGDHQWELEMLRAVPMAQYPYSNRKAMIPLIEDLVRFDRQTTVSNYHNITAYLLNVHNAQSNQTAALQQQQQNHESIASTSSSSSSVSSTTANNQATSLDHSLLPSGGGASITFATNNFNLTANHEMELFLNSDHFQEQIPLIEQNLLDLNEYEDLLQTATNFDIYYGLPLKDEPPIDLNLPFDIKIENIVQNELLSTTASSSSSSTLSTTTTVVEQKELKINNTDDKLINTTSNNENENENLISVNLNDIFKVEEDENDENLEENQNKLNEENETNEKLIKTEIKDELLSDTESHHDGLSSNNEDLTEQESEIVEVLWKQDVDLGYSLSPTKSLSSSNPEGTSSKNSDDDVEKLKALEELKLEKIKDDANKPILDDEWAGIPFTIDNETGEYIRLPLQLDEILQDVLQLAELTPETTETKGPIPSTSTAKDTATTTSNQRLDSTGKSLDEGLSSATDEDDDDLDSRQSLPSPLFDFDNASDLDEEIDMMIQSAGPFHQHHRSGGQNYIGSNSAFRQSTSFHHHHHHHQARVPLSRGVSMEQRLQDIASLFNPITGMGVSVGDMAPYSHYPNPYYQSGPPGMQHGQFGHHPVLHNASLADLGGTQPHYGHNLGSAVSSSMHLTNSSHENDSGATAYKMEHDMMYYSNTSSELNHTADGFINSILNDEDLQLMDMGVNDSFCPMRMVDCNTTSNNSSVLGAPSSSGGAGSSHHHHHNQHHNQLHASMQNHLRSGLGGLTSGIASGGGIGGTETVVGASLGSDGMGSSGDRLDASSDSAVSSMGSERVPSLSDGEWGEGSDSAQDYHQGKYGGTNGAGAGRTTGGPHDYSYNSRLGDAARQPPVAQKKHQMFGKRYFQDQPTHLPTLPHQQSQSLPIGTQQNLENLPGSIKYEYEPYPTGLHHSSSGLGLVSNISSMDGAVGPLIGKDNHIPSGHWSLDFAQPPRHHPRTGHELISHNHTYTLPQGTGSTPRPTLRDKKAIKKAQEDEHLTRDEKRARALNVPIAVPEIINLPMDEFNERLSKYDLTENQLSLIRDIRRRGKNKVAAQNCRKRKLDQILSLEDEVKEVRRKKDQYYSDRDMYLTEKNRISNKFAALHRHVFQYLRDPDGNLCSPTEYSLQQAADGSVYLLRRDTNKPVETNTSTNNSNTNSSNYDTPSNSNHHHYHQHHHLQQQQQQQQTPTQQHHHHSSQRPSPSSSSHHQKE